MTIYLLMQAYIFSILNEITVIQNDAFGRNPILISIRAILIRKHDRDKVSSACIAG